LTKIIKINTVIIFRRKKYHWLAIIGLLRILAVELSLRYS